MEKRRPHYLLTDALAQVRILGIDAFTRTAITDGQRLGLDGALLVEAVCEMKHSMFYKSMTTHRDNKIWQDVYHLPLANGAVAYVKITICPGSKVVIQFKERDDE